MEAVDSFVVERMNRVEAISGTNCLTPENVAVTGEFNEDKLVELMEVLNHWLVWKIAGSSEDG